MTMKAKHAFGSSSRIAQSLESGLINEHDILFLDGDTDNPKLGWIDAQGEIVIVPSAKDQVLAVDALPEVGEVGVIYVVGSEAHVYDGTQFVKISESTDLSGFEGRVLSLEEGMALLEEQVVAVDERVTTVEAKLPELESAIEIKLDAKEAEAKYITKKYEISGVPVGTLVSYHDKEIRVMVPADAQFVKQNVGAGGLANRYYITFKAYAPEGAVSFKEDSKPVVEDQTMWYFENNSSAGVDKFGRKYSVVWLSVAEYDEESDTWTYFGKDSTVDNYVGKDYSVEWYDADGVIIESDYIRTNLTNEECHSEVMPYYMANVTAELKAYTEELVDAKIEEITEIPVVEF